MNLHIRRVPFKMRGVEAQINDMLANGVIERAHNSEWCSPIVPVAKPDGSVQVCVDFRSLNAMTPLRRHVLYRAGNSSVMSTLDLMAGFHQIPMAKNSRDLTTFGCPQGHFHFLRMPLGYSREW